MIDEIWIWIALLLAAVWVVWAWLRIRSLTRRSGRQESAADTDRLDTKPAAPSLADLEAQADAARKVAEAEAARRAAQADAARRAAEVAAARREREQHQARLAAQAEAARLAAEIEAARLAAEQEARRRAEQAEAARLAAQAEEERLAAQAEAAHRVEQAEAALRAEQAEAARRAEQAEAARRAEQAEAARRAEQAEAARRAELAEAERLAALAALAASIPSSATRPLSAEQTLVMVADDSKVVRVKTNRLLAQHGYRVVLAEDGADAVRRIQAEAPHVLITDVDMPGLDGFELTRFVRGNAPTADIPVIMITAADDRHAAHAREVGVSVLLGKPYPEEQLLSHLATAHSASAVSA